MDKIPEMYLFVVSIEFIQQQGVEMTDEVEAAMPELLNQVTELAIRLAPEGATVTS
jgi:hydrogenase maturation protease